MSNDGGVSRRQVEKLADLPVTERRERVSELGELLSADSQYVTARAMELLWEVAEEYPGAVADVIDPVAEQLGTESLGTDAARVIGAVAAEEPAAVSERLPLLVAVLDSGGAVTANVTFALAAIGKTDPTDLARRGILETLFELVHDEDTAVRTNVTRILGDVAREEPGAIVDAADALRERLGDGSPAVQQNAAFALGQLAAHSPAAVVPAIEEFCGLLESDDAGVRASAAYALGATATAADELDQHTIDSLLGLLESEQPAVRQQAAFVLADVAESAPDALASHVRPLTRGLADSDPQTRQNLLAALQRLDATIPDAVETARADVSDALETVDPEAAGAEVTQAQLRGLAGEERAPDALQQAARDALVGAGGDSAQVSLEEEAVESADDSPSNASDTTGDQPDDPTASAGKQCPNCGEQFGQDATFCSVCGTSLE